MYPLAFWNNPTAIILIVLVVIVLFGGQKIPELMRGLGQGKRAFEEGLKETPKDLPKDDELRKEKEREAEIRRRVEEEMRLGK